MIYTLEFVNEQGEIEVLRYNAEDKSYDLKLVAHYGDGDDLPDLAQINLGIEIRAEGSGGLIQRLGQFRVAFKETPEAEFEEKDRSYFTIRKLIELDEVSGFMEDIVVNLKRAGILAKDGTVSQAAPDIYHDQWDIAKTEKPVLN